VAVIIETDGLPLAVSDARGNGERFLGCHGLGRGPLLGRTTA
jgi:hypothetical protein